MARVVDFETRNIDLDRTRNVLRRAQHFYRMGNDVDRSAAFHTGSLIGILDMHRNAHANLGARTEPQEIHVYWQVLHGIELKVARNDTVFGAVDLKLVDGRKKVSPVDALLQLGMVDRYADGVLSVAINHSRHAAGASFRRGSPLAANRAHRRFHLQDVGHNQSSCSVVSAVLANASAELLLLQPRHASRGVWIAGCARLYRPGA